MVDEKSLVHQGENGVLSYTLRALTQRLNPEYFSEDDIDRLPPYGMFSVILVGDGAQLPPVEGAPRSNFFLKVRFALRSVRFVICATTQDRLTIW